MSLYVPALNENRTQRFHTSHIIIIDIITRRQLRRKEKNTNPVLVFLNFFFYAYRIPTTTIIIVDTVSGKTYDRSGGDGSEKVDWSAVKTKTAFGFPIIQFNTIVSCRGVGGVLAFSKAQYNPADTTS